MASKVYCHRGSDRPRNPLPLMGGAGRHALIDIRLSKNSIRRVNPSYISLRILYMLPWLQLLAKDQCSPSHGTSMARACLLPVPGAAGCQVGDSFCCCHPSMMAIFICLRYRNPNQKQSSSSESHPASLLAWLRCLCFFREPSSLACWHDSAASHHIESSM